MTRYLLDTNVISNVTKPTPAPALVDWMAAQADGDLFISSLTIAEIRRGVLEMPSGKSARSWSGGSPAGRVLRPCLPAACSPSMRTRPSFGRG